MESQETLLQEIWEAIIPLIFSETGLIATVTPIVIGSMVAGRSAIIKAIMHKVERIIVDVAIEYGLDQQKRAYGSMPIGIGDLAKHKAMIILENELTQAKGLARFTTHGIRSSAIERAINTRNKNAKLRSVDLSKPRTKGR